MSDLAASINRHIGRPWSAQGFDCWALVRAIYADAFGILLPPLPGVDGDDHRAAARAVSDLSAAGDWQRIDHPRDGDAIVMGRRDRPHHCGVWMSAAGGSVAHCDHGAGVRCESMRLLAAQGWGSFIYYRHRLRA